jgi:hypothetical protein
MVANEINGKMNRMHYGIYEWYEYSLLFTMIIISDEHIVKAIKNVIYKMTNQFLFNMYYHETYDSSCIT